MIDPAERNTLRWLNRRVSPHGLAIAISRSGKPARYVMIDAHTGNPEAWTDDLQSWKHELQEWERLSPAEQQESIRSVGEREAALRA